MKLYVVKEVKEEIKEIRKNQKNPSLYENILHMLQGFQDDDIVTISKDSIELFSNRNNSIESSMRNIENRQKEIKKQNVKLNDFTGKGTSDKIKNFIISLINDNQIKEVMQGFYFSSEEEENKAFPEFKKLMSKKTNWKRTYRYKEDYGWERYFYCVGFDDQLKFYIQTDSTDTNILDYEFSCE